MEYDFGILLGLAYQEFVTELHVHLKAAGFTLLGPSFGYVLRSLAQENLTASQLAVRLGITSQGAAKIVDEMVSAGYAERGPDPMDGRIKRLSLTPHGWAALESARSFHHDYERRLGERLGAGEVETVRKVLTALVHGSDSPDGLARVLRPF